MPAATARVESLNPEAVAKAAQTLQRSVNGPLVMQGDMNAQRDPKFFIYIYNCGPTEQNIPRPWAIGGRIHIPACPRDKDYIEALKIPDIIQENAGIMGSNEIVIRGRDGRFYAQDAINPDDPQGSWKSTNKINSGLSTNMGTNLYRYGLFWSTSNPPEKEAIEKARLLWNETASELIAQGNELWTAQQDPKYAGDRVGKLHKLAAAWLDVETSWHRKLEIKKVCPSCGEQIPQAAIICRHCDATLDWGLAVQLGRRTKKQAEDSGIKL